MKKEYLQNYIENNIPIVKEMGFLIESIESNKVTVVGDYCKHINHTKSVFGGSISSVMTLTGWARVRTLIENFDSKATIVIKNNYTDFLKPVVKNYRVSTIELAEKDISKLIKTYKKFGRGRIKVDVVLSHVDNDEILTSFTGEYVVLKNN